MSSQHCIICSNNTFVSLDILFKYIGSYRPYHKISLPKFLFFQVRFLSDLVNCHVIVAGSLLAMFDNFIEVSLEDNIPQVTSI